MNYFNAPKPPDFQVALILQASKGTAGKDADNCLKPETFLRGPCLKNRELTQE
jgi:hypothetical protein